jgi:radical SAM protein with 4Fe4S-binding SPASM domain
MTKTHKFHNQHLLSACPPDVDKKEWDEFRSMMAAASDLQEHSHPLQIDVELNAGCNMACPFCVHGYQKIENNLLDRAKFEKILKEAVSIGVKSVKFNYINEPMLRKDLEEIIRWTKDQGIINIYMVTNGTLLTAKRRESLMQSGLTKLFVSLDAVTEDTYNRQRLSGQFNKVVTNVLAFIKERNETGQQFPLVRVSFLRNQINKHEEKAFQEFWQDKADLIAFQKMNEIPDRKTSLTIADAEMPSKGCDLPFKQLVIDDDGEILPCCKLAGKKLPIGNIDTMTLQEAWDSSKMKHLRSIHSSKEWQNHDVCRNCMCND